jgi:hypothetical protein
MPSFGSCLSDEFASIAKLAHTTVSAALLITVNQQLVH